MKARLAGLLALLALIGCGGGGGGTSGTPTPTTASLNLTIAWPTRGRIVPVAAETVRTTVRASASLPVSGELVLTRPASSGRITGIPAGAQLVTSEALDASGKVVAARTVQMTFTGGDAPGISIDMDSSVATLAVAPASPTVNVGASVTLSANATNDRGDGVLLTPSKLSWSVISGASFASVNSTSGLVTGLAAGTAVVQVLDSESRRTGNATVNVTSTLPGTATLDMTVVWPSRGRIIPGASESIRTQIRASLSQPVTGQLVLTRPTDSGRITGVPVGAPQLVISEALDANGKAVASRTVQMSFSAGSTTSMTIDLDSSVASVSITPSTASIGIGESVTLLASGKNDKGDAVLLTPSRLQWSVVSGAGYASLNVSTGVVTGASAGTTTFQLLDTESGRSATSVITVLPPPGMQDFYPHGHTLTVSKTSRDGSVVVGYDQYDKVGYRWSSAEGNTFLGTLGGADSSAFDVSADGLVVVGEAKTAGFGYRAFRWTKAGGMVSLGTLGADYSQASAVSDDGSTVVGYSQTSDGKSHAFIWKASTGMQPLDLSLDGSFARDVSGDGSVIIGSRKVGATWESFRWTASGGFQSLGSFGAMAISSDGSVIVGVSNSKAARWTATSGVSELGSVGGAQALDVSRDGTIVVGRASNAFGERAFYWTASKGMVILGTLGGEYSTANGVSGDGKFIVGDSDLANGMMKGFRMLTP